jgi:hypothetical protein
MTRDCTAWIRSEVEPSVAAECGVIGEHVHHVGNDAEGHLLIWLDSDEGARRG